MFGHPRDTRYFANPAELLTHLVEGLALDSNELGAELQITQVGEDFALEQKGSVDPCYFLERAMNIHLRHPGDASVLLSDYFNSRLQGTNGYWVSG